jgi:predicted DNA-binding ribbon-helix-helix protein
MRRDTTETNLPPPDTPIRAAKSVSTLVNRNVTVGGHRTSIRLEPAMWEALHEICRREGKTLNELVTEIHRQRVESSLTAAIRVYLLRYFSAAATDEGHRLAGHGLPNGGGQLPV